MGAWGTGPLQNDTAMDFADDFRKPSNRPACRPARAPRIPAPHASQQESNQ